jgi:Tol biopolymer transport system component
MNRTDRFDDVVSDWLHADAEHRVPEHLDAVLLRTRTERQRPAWSSLERWLPMQTTLRLTPIPRIAWLLVIVALVAALGVAVLAIGAQHRPPAPPFGLARNGLIVYSLSDGDIHGLDPDTGTSKVLISGPEIDRAPHMSRDGSRLLFDRETAGALSHTLMVANADGTDIRPLGPPLANVDSIDWSPDGTQVSMSSDADGRAGIRVVGLDGTTTLVFAQDSGTVAEAAEQIQWRPDGRELVLHGWSNALSSFGLYAIRPDGTDHLHPIVAAATVSTNDYGNPALSPDGTSIAYTDQATGSINVVDVTTGVDRPLVFDGTSDADSGPVWSPDGSHLAFQRYVGSTVRLVIAPAAGGQVVETGPTMPDDGAGVAVQFSPDGSKLVALYLSDHSTWILDSAGGQGRRVPAAVTELADWQRLAP